MKAQEAIEATRDVIRRKGLAYATESVYCHWVGRFGSWLRSQPSLPESPEKRLEGFLTSLARSGVAASTQNQAFNACLFFYRHVLGVNLGNVDALRAKQPSFVRHAPPVEDVASLLAAVEDSPVYPFRLLVGLLYGCGLRVTEPLNLRIRDLDLASGTLVLRGAKGGKDRVVKLPDCLRPAINRQIAAARVVFERAVSAGIPVKLPNQLGKKYPAAASSFPWFWLFPAPKACVDPRGGALVWWRCHEAAVQNAVRKAAKAVGLTASISPHHLRHAWATHAHAAGASVRDLQVCLGHKSLETTMVYLHPEPERVTSPLDALRFAV